MTDDICILMCVITKLLAEVKLMSLLSKRHYKENNIVAMNLPVQCALILGICF